MEQLKKFGGNPQRGQRTSDQVMVPCQGWVYRAFHLEEAISELIRITAFAIGL
jgi:hypothetical protein